MALSLPIEPEATKLLQESPLALLLGMLLDQQIPMEKAFSSPFVLKQRLGRDLDAHELAAFDPDALTAIFAKPPALHRFPKAFAKRAQELCQVLVDRYDGDASRLWTGVKTGAEVVKRVGELPGFGKQKSQIFVALLAKQLGVRPEGWERAVGAYAEDGYRSVADVTDPASLQKVRDFKKAKKAEAKAQAG